MNLITRRRLSCPHRDRENRRRYVPRVSAYVRTDPGLDVAGLVAVTRIGNQDVHVLSGTRALYRHTERLGDAGGGDVTMGRPDPRLVVKT
jgi:hypothetical protein